MGADCSEMLQKITNKLKQTQNVDATDCLHHKGRYVKETFKNVVIVPDSNT